MSEYTIIRERSTDEFENQFADLFEKYVKCKLDDVCENLKQGTDKKLDRLVDVTMRFAIMKLTHAVVDEIYDDGTDVISDALEVPLVLRKRYIEETMPEINFILEDFMMGAYWQIISQSLLLKNNLKSRLYDVANSVVVEPSGEWLMFGLHAIFDSLGTMEMGGYAVTDPVYIGIMIYKEGQLHNCPVEFHKIIKDLIRVKKLTFTNFMISIAMTYREL